MFKNLDSFTVELLYQKELQINKVIFLNECVNISDKDQNQNSIHVKILNILKKYPHYWHNTTR